jgi:magnesium chelatase family protein
VRKTGSGLDLPIALALMIASGYLAPATLEPYLVAGELSLSGKVCIPPGIVSIALLASERDRILLTGKVGAIRTIIQDPIAQVESLRTIAESDELAGDQSFSCDEQIREEQIREEPATLDYSDVVNQDAAIRALTIAAVGGHNLLMVGEPGTGKTMLARRLPTILSDLEPSEMLEIAQIYSTIDPAWRPRRSRPFRSPHHSASSVGLIGGGSPIRPGEVTLSHHGILFLDEIPEFKPASLQMLRQPMESGHVTIVRATEAVSMPAAFQLIATANPCPCGYYGSTERSCRCTMQRIEQYRSRLGGPLVDRIDMTIMVPRPQSDEIIRLHGTHSSAQIKEQVIRAKEFARHRHPDADVAHAMCDYLADNRFTPEALRLLRCAAESFMLSGRALGKVSRIARTIADLELCDDVIEAHVAEAMDYRNHWVSERTKSGGGIR